MREFLFLIAALVLMIWPVAGAPVCAEGYAAGVDVDTIGQCTVGPFVFSNFSLRTGPKTDGALVGPNLLNPIFTYQATDPLSEIDGALGGTGLRSLAETVCGAPFAGNACPSLKVPPPLVLDWTKTVAKMTLTESAGPYYVLKDISLAPGATLSGFAQSYHPPDPAALLLIGSGLIVLGMFRRSRKT